MAAHSSSSPNLNLLRSGSSEGTAVNKTGLSSSSSSSLAKSKDFLSKSADFTRKSMKSSADSIKSDKISTAPPKTSDENPLKAAVGKASSFWNPRFKLGKVSATFASAKEKFMFFDNGHSFADTYDDWQGLDSCSYHHARPHVAFGELQTVPGAGEYHTTGGYDTNFGNRVSTPLGAIEKEKGTTPVLPNIYSTESTVVPLPKEIFNKKPSSSDTLSLFKSQILKVPGDHLRHAVSPGPLAYIGSSDQSSVDGQSGARTMMRKKGNDTKPRSNIASLLDRPPPGPMSYDLSYDPSKSGNLVKIIAKFCKESKGNDFIPGIKQIFDTAKSAGYLGKMIGSEVSNSILLKHNSKSEKLMKAVGDHQFDDDDVDATDDSSLIRWANDCVLKKQTKREKYLEKLENMFNSSAKGDVKAKKKVGRKALDLMAGWPFGGGEAPVGAKTLTANRKDANDSNENGDNISVSSKKSKSSKSTLSRSKAATSSKKKQLSIYELHAKKKLEDDWSIGSRSYNFGGASVSTFDDNASLGEDSLKLDLSALIAKSKHNISPLKLQNLNRFGAQTPAEVKEDELLKSIGSTRRLNQVEIDQRILEIQSLYWQNLFEKSIMAAERYLIQLRHLSGLLVNYNRICIMCHIGECYKIMGLFERSFEYYENALSLSVNIFGDKSVCAASCLAVIGDLYCLCGQADHGRNLVMNAYKIIQVEIHRSNADMTITEKDYIVATYVGILIGLAHIYIEQSDYSKLHSLMSKLESLVDEFYVDFTLLGQYYTIQVIYNRLIGLYDVAMKYTQQMMDLYVENRIESKSFLFSDVYENMFYICLESHDLVEATRLLNDIDEIRTACYTSQHYNYTDVLYMRALLCLELGKYTPALHTLHECLSLKIQTLGKKHHSVAQTLISLVDCQRMRGYPLLADESLNFFWDLMDAGETKCNDKMMYEVQVAEANNQLCKGRYQDALQLFTSALEIAYQMQSALKLDSFRLVETCKLFMSRAHCLGGDVNIAVSLLNEFESTKLTFFPNDHLYCDLAQLYLCERLFLTGQYVEAQSICSKTLEKYENSKESANKLFLSSVASSQSENSMDYQSNSGYFLLELLILNARIELGLGNVTESLYLVSQSKKAIKMGYKRSVYDAIASSIMAECFRINKLYNESTEYFRLAAILISHSVGENSHHYGQLLVSKSEYFCQINQLKEAKGCLQMAFDITSEAAPNCHIASVQLMFLDAYYKYCSGESRESEKMFVDVIVPFIENNISYEHPLILFVQAFLGKAILANAVKTDRKEYGHHQIRESIASLKSKGILENHYLLKILTRDDDEDEPTPSETPKDVTERM